MLLHQAALDIRGGKSTAAVREAKEILDAMNDGSVRSTYLKPFYLRANRENEGMGIDAICESMSRYLLIEAGKR